MEFVINVGNYVIDVRDNVQIVGDYVLNVEGNVLDVWGNVLGKVRYISSLQGVFRYVNIFEKY